MAYNNLLVEIDGALATVTLNRPKAMNALNDETITELGQALAEVYSLLTVDHFSGRQAGFVSPHKGKRICSYPYDIRRPLTDRTKVMIINSPSNP